MIWWRWWWHRCMYGSTWIASTRFSCFFFAAVVHSALQIEEIPKLRWEFDHFSQCRSSIRLERILALLRFEAKCEDLKGERDESLRTSFRPGITQCPKRSFRIAAERWSALRTMIQFSPQFPSFFNFSYQYVKTNQSTIFILKSLRFFFVSFFRFFSCVFFARVASWKHRGVKNTSKYRRNKRKRRKRKKKTSAASEHSVFAASRAPDNQLKCSLSLFRAVDFQPQCHFRVSALRLPFSCASAPFAFIRFFRKVYRNCQLCFSNKRSCFDAST